jgi:RING finger/CCCH-type zinc finger protein
MKTVFFFMVCFHFQTSINTEIDNLPVNFALLQLVGASVPETEGSGNVKHLTKEDLKNYLQAKKCIEELALYLKPFSSGKFPNQNILSAVWLPVMCTVVCSCVCALMFLGLGNNLLICSDCITLNG